MKLPIIRNQNIVVQEIGSEIMIYDLEINKAYSLNETSAIVYQNCDGKMDVAELCGKYGFPNEIIYLALDQLQNENLLERNAEFLSPFKALSRREVVKKVGLSSMIMLPFITSIVAPTSVNAQSGCAPGLLAAGQTTVFVCTGPSVGDCLVIDGCNLAVPGFDAGAECCSGTAAVGTCIPGGGGGEQCTCVCA